MSDMTSKQALRPERGLGAGSADATSELASYMLRLLREAQKMAEGKDEVEPQAEATSKAVRMWISKKTSPKENEKRQEARQARYEKAEGKEWLWLSLRVEDLSVCGAHHNAAIHSGFEGD